MSDFDTNKLRRLDATVLLIFLGLMSHRKAARVAADLGLTNSSISHALKRLRDVFQDDLFLRRPHGLEPTDFAHRIEPDIRRALDALQIALSGPGDFDPATGTGHVRLAARDLELVSYLPDALSAMMTEAPGLTFSIRSPTRSDALAALNGGQTDFAIGFFAAPGPAVESHLLRTETYRLAARSNHPILSGALTTGSYAACQHVLVAEDGSRHGIVDETLEKIGLKRHVALSLPSFLPALSVLARSDFVATLPASIVCENAARFGLGHRAPPVEVRKFPVSLLRHVRTRGNPMLDWVQARLIAANKPFQEASSRP